MAICKTGSESVPERSFQAIADHIRRKVVYEGLELDEIGIDLADVTDDVRLFDEDGLNLDSIDALEILAGVQREFGLSIPNVDQEFMNEHCATVGRLTRMVQGMSESGDVRGTTRDDAVAGRPQHKNVEDVSANEAAGSMSSSRGIGDARPGEGIDAKSANPAADA